MDMKFFRETTTGKVVVMGRKTLESFPNGLPLKNRTNIVLTHNKNYDGKGAIVVNSMEELREELKKYNSEDIYVIGGEQIYKALVDDCDVAHITKINFAYDANIPSVPENQLVVYSLLENYSIRQAISSYAKEHPDTYVKYEIGLNNGDATTQSDALKTLNTEIIAGNGPDVIILDGFCPCKLGKLPENKCMCEEFKAQIKDPEFEGYCHCMLYYKTKD